MKKIITGIIFLLLINGVIAQCNLLSPEIQEQYNTSCKVLCETPQEGYNYYNNSFETPVFNFIYPISIYASQTLNQYDLNKMRLHIDGSYTLNHCNHEGIGILENIFNSEDLIIPSLLTNGTPPTQAMVLAYLQIKFVEKYNILVRPLPCYQLREICSVKNEYTFTIEG